MKRSTLALSIVAILGAAVTGGSWYTGKQIEQHFAQWVQESNENLKPLNQYGVELAINNVQIERNLFCSDVVYTLDAQIEGESYQFQGKDKIYHGPLPLNRLSKGKLLPMMAGVESHISVPEELKSYFLKPELLTANTDISYAVNFSGDFNIAGLKVEMAQGVLETSDLSGEMDINQAGEGKVRATLPSLKLQDEANDSLIGFEQLEYEMDNQASDYDLLSVGDYKVKWKSYAIGGLSPNSPQISINNATMNGYSKINNGVYESASDFVAQLVGKDGNENAQDFGKLKMDMLMSLDAKGTNEFVSYFTSPEKIQSPEAKDALFALLQKPAQLHLKTLSLENSKGSNDLALILNSNGFNLEQIGDLSQVLALFKESKLETKLNIATTEETLTQFYSLNPQTKDNAAAQAKMTVAELVAQAQNSDFAVVDQENIRLKLELDQGKVKLNGNEVPESQVQTALLLLMFGFGGMGQ